MAATAAQFSVGDVDGAGLWAVIDEAFLATLGWDPERRVLFFPEDHPVMVDFVRSVRLPQGGPFIDGAVFLLRRSMEENGQGPAAGLLMQASRTSAASATARAPCPAASDRGDRAGGHSGLPMTGNSRRSCGCIWRSSWRIRR